MKLSFKTNEGSVIDFYARAYFDLKYYNPDAAPIIGLSSTTVSTRALRR